MPLRHRYCLRRHLQRKQADAAVENRNASPSGDLAERHVDDPNRRKERYVTRPPDARLVGGAGTSGLAAQRQASGSAGLGSAAVRSTPASAATTAKSAATTNGRRPPASWASLEPPSWLRTGNPPPVPGVNAQEPEATQLAQASAPRKRRRNRCNPSRRQRMRRPGSRRRRPVWSVERPRPPCRERLFRATRIPLRLSKIATRPRRLRRRHRPAPRSPT